MNNPEPTIRVNVDVTNPGQFFACCGLLELADRLWPGAEGWFDEKTFCIGCNGTLHELLMQLATTEIESSLTDRELKRLGTLLSAEKAKLTTADAKEKEQLIAMWKNERLHLSGPFDLWLDWWADDRTGAKGMKTWAAKQLVLEMARAMLRSLKSMAWDEGYVSPCLSQATKVDGVPFYFDSHNNSQNTPRDTGFGLYTLRNQLASQDNTRPLLELAAFIGIQRFRPVWRQDRRAYCFNVWPIPLPVSVAGVAVTGALPFPDQRVYSFRMLKRSEYMKAFLSAQPFQGD